MPQPDENLPPAAHHSDPFEPVPLPLLPYRSESLFPIPPDVDPYKGVGLVAFVLAVFPWLIGIASYTTGFGDATGCVQICGGFGSWILSLTLGVTSASRGPPGSRLAALVAVALDLVLLLFFLVWRRLYH